MVARGPIDYGPVLLLIPFGFQLTMDTLSSGGLRSGVSAHTLRIPPHDGHPVLRSTARNGFRSTLAVSSFRLRARLGFSIPFPFSGQRGITPAFGYSAPHPGAGGTSTLLNNALLSAHYGLG